jgi:hypothetical protein
LALLTPKNNPLFDVVVTSPDGTRSVSVQVKTRSEHNKQGWKFGTDITNQRGAPGMFVELVKLITDTAPEFYIYEYSALSRRVLAVYTAYMANQSEMAQREKKSVSDGLMMCRTLKMMCREKTIGLQSFAR